MAFRRIALSLLAVAMLGVACGGDSDSGDGINLSQPIAEHNPGQHVEPDAGEQDDSPGTSDPPAVIVKDALVNMSVAHRDLTSATQEIVDLVVSPRVGGFLSQSELDREDGYGTANVLIKVPAFTFEEVVSQLNQIGDIRRQSIQGDDRSEAFARARQKVQLTENRVKGLLNLLDETEDAAARFELRQKIAAAKADLDTHSSNADFIEAQTTFSTIDVYLEARAPVTPDEPVIERALGTAKDISLAIASGLLLAAGVLVPIGAILFVIYAIAMFVRKRMRPRLQS